MLTGDFTPKKQNKTYNSIHITIITTYGILMSGCQTLLKHYNFTEKLKIKSILRKNFKPIKHVTQDDESNLKIS